MFYIACFFVAMVTFGAIEDFLTDRDFLSNS